MFPTLILLFLAVSATPAVRSQAAIPSYNFWDDSPWENKLKTTYREHTRNPVQNTDEGACVNSCISSSSCVTFYYNPSTRTCEKVPINLLANVRGQDSSVRFDDFNLYFRFVPPADFCPMLKCYFFDRRAKICFKLLVDSGPSENGQFTMADATRACQAEEGQLATVDTQLKLEQMDLTLKNFPRMIVGPRNWKTVIVGARRSGGRNSKYCWVNGRCVAPAKRSFWSLRYSAQNRGNGYDCLVMEGYRRPGVDPGNSFTRYRLQETMSGSRLQETQFTRNKFRTSHCTTEKHPAALCERVRPTAHSG